MRVKTSVQQGRDLARRVAVRPARGRCYPPGVNEPGTGHPISDEVNAAEAATYRRQPILIGLAAILVAILAAGALWLSQPRLSDAEWI
jgi:hypothetical protein